MADSKRLNSVVKLMNHRQQEAATRLGDCARQRERQRQRLQELETYRKEYLHSYQSYMQVGMCISRVIGYHQFIGHLEQAISEQRQNVCNADREYESCKQEWLNRRCSVKAVDEMVSRYQAQEQRLDGRREQYENDERSHLGGSPWNFDRGN